MAHGPWPHDLDGSGWIWSLQNPLFPFVFATGLSIVTCITVMLGHVARVSGNQMYPDVTRVLDMSWELDGGLGGGSWNDRNCSV